MKEKFTVFYAWHSDHPSNHCRYLIAEALDAAAKAISDDPVVPYRIEIDQDTKGVPGLCDIPATILAKIERSDAVVADLTYVAQTAGDPPRFCSNPNVLFEVGFAFRAIRPERLILVMNEHYGPTTQQIFDLDHRRHPIAYVFPGTTSRNDVIRHLARDLEAAIRPIASLGTLAGSTAIGSQAREEEIQRMQAELDELSDTMPRGYYWTGAIYPSSARERWSRLAELEKAIHVRRAHEPNGDEYPPHMKGNERRGWGIANKIYGQPWIVTKSGLFLCRHPMDFREGPFPPPRHGEVDPTRKQIPAGQWVDVKRWREDVLTFFAFAQRWAGEFNPQEVIAVELHARIKGLHMVASGTTLERFVDGIEPAVASEFKFFGELTVEQFRAEWKELCAEAIDAFVDLFPPTMGENFPSRAWVYSAQPR